MNTRQLDEMNAKAIHDAGEAILALANGGIENDRRIIELEQRIGQLETTLKQVTANLTAIIADGAETNTEIDCILRQRVDRHDDRLKRLETAVLDFHEHIEKLEAGAALSKEQRLQVIANAAVIGKLAERIRQLGTCVTEQAKRVGKLEAALKTWLIVGNWDTAATSAMHKRDIMTGRLVLPTPGSE